MTPNAFHRKYNKIKYDNMLACVIKLVYSYSEIGT